jgi:uncharacterized protein affecting Mg2+/Co2+ transport
MPSTTTKTRTNTRDMAEHNTASAVARQGSLSARAVGESQYLPDWSEPRSGFWTSGYTMEIVNATTRAVWIERRHWEIHPKGGKPEKTDGAGIGGKVRLIPPGETFRYWSATPLSRPDGGWMTGRFSGRFDDRDGERVTGERVTIPVERFELARAEGKPIERDHDKDAAAQQKRELNLKLAAYIKKTKAGDAALDAADLPVAWQWEFTRFCMVGGNFNRHKESGVAAGVLQSAFHILVASDADLIHTDRAIYTENGGFEKLHLILTYCKPAQDWQLGGPVNEPISPDVDNFRAPEPKPFKLLPDKAVAAFMEHAKSHQWNDRQEKGWPYHTNAFKFLHVTHGKFIPGLTRDLIAAGDDSLAKHLNRKISMEGLPPWLDLPTGAEAKLRAINDPIERGKVLGVREFFREQKQRYRGHKAAALGD